MLWIKTETGKKLLGKWIKTSQALPKVKEGCKTSADVALRNDEYYSVGHIRITSNGIMWEYDNKFSQTWDLRYFSHWTPLPEPPEETIK